MNCIRCHATLLTSELLCPACKVIIDYSAVEAQAAAMCEAATTPALRSAARLLQFAANGACRTEVELLKTDLLSQAQLDRLEKLWTVSCDRANKMDAACTQILSARPAVRTRLLPSDFSLERMETNLAIVLRGWAEEMMAVPRIVAQGKVPPDDFQPTWGRE